MRTRKRGGVETRASTRMKQIPNVRRSKRLNANIVDEPPQPPQRRRERRRRIQEQPVNFFEDEVAIESEPRAPERVINPLDDDRMPVFISKESKKRRQRKFKRKRKTCRQQKILLDDPNLCDPVILTVQNDHDGLGKYIILANRRIRLGNKVLRGRYRNLQDKELTEIVPVAAPADVEEVIDISPHDFGNLVQEAVNQNPEPERPRYLTRYQKRKNR